MDAILSDLAYWCGAMALAYAACYAAGRRCAGCPAYAGDCIFGILYYPALVYLAFDSTYSLGGDVDARWSGTTPSSELLGRLLVSRMLVHAPYLFLKRDPTYRGLYLFHHALVAVNYGAGLVLAKSQFWGSAAALCEASNVFLNFQELANAFPDTAEATPTWAGRLNDRCFFWSYVVFRLVLFPLLLAGQVRDRLSFSMNLGFCEGALFPASIVFVFCLSLKWALAGPKPTPTKKPKATPKKPKAAPATPKKTDGGGGVRRSSPTLLDPSVPAGGAGAWKDE